MSTRTQWKKPLAVNVQAISRQKTIRAAGIPPDMTVAEFVHKLLLKMELPVTDAEGRAISYHVRSDREGRHLHASELVGDVLQTGDLIVLHPNIQAG
jgi:hypothetical protein